MLSMKHAIKGKSPATMSGSLTAAFLRSLCVAMMLFVVFSPVLDIVNDYDDNARISKFQLQHETNEHQDHEPLSHFLYSSPSPLSAVPSLSLVPCFLLLQNTYCIAHSIEHPPEALLFS